MAQLPRLGDDRVELSRPVVATACNRPYLAGLDAYG